MGDAATLVTPGQMAARVATLAGELDGRYAGSSEPPLLVGVLTGSAFFLADLVRAMTIHVNLDFISISSYRGPQPRVPGGGRSGVVRIVKDIDIAVTGRDVVIIEDIVDTGLTLNYLRKTLAQRSPRSLTAVALLDKAARRIVPVPVEYRGFEIPDVFVVGYGLDWQGLYRNFPGLLAVRDVARLANNRSLLVHALAPPGVA